MNISGGGPMKVEDALVEAMARHVADVHAPPTLGRAVRRGHRARVIGFRTAGMALVTAAVTVTVAVPLMLNTGEPAPARHTANGPDRAVVRTVTVPDVVGLTQADAVTALRAAGLEADDPVGRTGKMIVGGQDPAPGQKVAEGHRVGLLPVDPAEPQDLGDLGDGRAFGGIRIGYLPEGLEWSRWSGKNRFGKTSYTTSFAPGGDDRDGYGVQVVVLKGEAAEAVERRLSTFPSTKVNGRKAYLARHEAGRVVEEPGELGTLTMGWFVRDALAVELYISPGYEKKIDARAEIRRVAESISAES